LRMQCLMLDMMDAMRERGKLYVIR